MEKRLFITFILLLTLTMYISCSEEFLDVKRNQKILIPNSLEELQALLDNDQVMNYSPGLGMIASDDFYISETGFMSLNELQQRIYLLDTKSSIRQENSDWNKAYQQIFYSNIVLEGLEVLPQKEEEYKEIRAAALFYRSYALFGLLQHFAPPYSAKSRGQSSIPLPLKADINSQREVVNVETAYNQVEKDLIDAASDLPDLLLVRTRPSNVAAYSLLGRIYLLKGEYVKAEQILEKAMSIHSELLNYNNLSVTEARPFPTPYPTGPGNTEIIFYNRFIAYSFFSSNNLEVKISEELMKSYTNEDLRGSLYFTTTDSVTYNFRGSYSGIRRGDLYTGLTVDENYLNYAEACVRNGNLTKGLEVINKLLIQRYKTGMYIDFETQSKSEALKFILEERRKSLVGRGTRWFDIRRFINDDVFFIDAHREINSQDIRLVKEDARVWLELQNN